MWNEARCARSMWPLWGVETACGPFGVWKQHVAFVELHAGWLGLLVEAAVPDRWWQRQLPPLPPCGVVAQW